MCVNRFSYYKFTVDDLYSVFDWCKVSNLVDKHICIYQRSRFDLKTATYRRFLSFKFGVVTILSRLAVA